MSLCEYGCGQEAKHQFKNGRWCCSFSWRKCPAKAAEIYKNQVGKKRIITKVRKDKGTTKKIRREKFG